MIVATTFASNIARVKMLAEAGSRAGRSICIMGRAMHRMIETALEAGTLCEFPKVVSAAEAAGFELVDESDINANRHSDGLDHYADCRYRKPDYRATRR